MYRIVQEALTNARRHAPGAAVDVELDYAADALHLRVRDNGPGPSDAAATNGSSTGGHGLLGMRERAAAVGGSCGPARRRAAASWSRPPSQQPGRHGDGRRMSSDLPVRIVVVDDQEVVRAGFAALLGHPARLHGRRDRGRRRRGGAGLP